MTVLRVVSVALILWAAWAPPPLIAEELPYEVIGDDTLGIVWIDLCKLDVRGLREFLQDFLVNFPAYLELDGRVGQWDMKCRALVEAGATSLVWVSTEKDGTPDYTSRSTLIHFRDGCDENTKRRALATLESRWKRDGTPGIDNWVIVQPWERGFPGAPSVDRAVAFDVALRTINQEAIRGVLIPNAEMRERAARSPSPSGPSHFEAMMRLWRDLQAAEFVGFSVTIGLPAIIVLQMRMPTVPAAEGLARGIEDLIRRSQNETPDLFFGIVSRTIRTGVVETDRNDVRVEMKLRPLGKFPAIGAHLERRDDRPQRYRQPVPGHLREFGQVHDSKRYRITVYACPAFASSRPKYDSRIAVAQAPLLPLPSTPLFETETEFMENVPPEVGSPRRDDPSIRYSHGIWLGYAIGTIRYDPVADEFLLLERPEFGHEQTVLRKANGVSWTTAKLEGTIDRFTDVSEVAFEQQSDENLLKWVFGEQEDSPPDRTPPRPIGPPNFPHR